MTKTSNAKSYFSLFKVNLINSLQYRVSAFAGIATQVCFGFMYVLLFSSFYKMGNVPEDFSYSQMVSYIWLQQAFFAYFGMFARHKELVNAVTQGNISYELVRPINLYNKWFATLYSDRLGKAALRFVPLIVIAALLPQNLRLAAPASIPHLALFGLSFVISGFLCVALCMLCYAVLFKTMAPNGTFSLFTIFGQFLAGSLIPIPLMPTIMQKILNFLPFRYMGDLTLRLYVGSISIKSGLIQIAIQCVWLVALVAIGKLCFHKNLKKIEVQGG